MRVHVLQHVPFEDLGSIRPWLEERGARITYTRFFANDPPPDLDRTDMVIALGGPMSVNDEAALPWLKVEKQIVRDAVVKDLPVLGVCLGAQLIASALGARVYPNTLKEIGWFPIQAVGEAPGVFRFPSECDVFHWHGETFDLPAGAVLLASSSACKHQAFQLKRNVIALQFHLEMTPAAAVGILEECRNELVVAPFVQSEQDLRAVPASRYHAVNVLMGDVLTYLLDDTHKKA